MRTPIKRPSIKDTKIRFTCFILITSKIFNIVYWYTANTRLIVPSQKASINLLYTILHKIANKLWKLLLKLFRIIKYYYFLFKLFLFSFSNCFKLFLGVGNSSGIVPPFFAITSLIFLPIL